VLKYRGTAFKGGFHDFVIGDEGVDVFPRLVASDTVVEFARDDVRSGNARLDALLGGGIETGSSTLVLGPAGTGKSLLVLTFVAAAVARGEKAAIFVFDEEVGLLFKRMKAFGIDLQAFRDRGDIVVEQVDAAALSPGEFAHRVRAAVDRHQIKTVVIDSLTGYEAAMPDEHALALHIHEILLYLNRQGVTTFVTVAQHGLVGDMGTPVDVTYLADSVILLRYFEADGDMRRAISIVKKRTGAHESKIREYRIGSTGLQLGEPLHGFRGVLSGTPVYTGDQGALLDGKRT
jgi:circadian clock protein KaiC